MGRANAAPSGSAEKTNGWDSHSSSFHGEEIAAPQTATQIPNGGGDGFISKKELAWRLRVTVRTISNWQQRGLLPFVKCRRAIYYDWKAVAAHLRARARVCKEAREERVMRIPVLVMAKDLTRRTPRSRRAQRSVEIKNHE